MYNARRPPTGPPCRARPQSPAAAAPADLRRRGALAFAGLAALPAAALGAAGPALPWSFAAATAATYAAVAAAALLRLGRHAPHRRFGLANRITTARAGIVSLFGGAAAAAPDLPAGLLWALAAGAALELALDGLDGRIARRRGLASGFGAAFDQEIDALFVLLLAVLVWRLDRAGAWVLAIGAMRYLLLAAGLVWPALRRPLPPRRRRQAVCGLQIVALAACLPPLLPAPAQQAALAAALAALACSFLADLRWLLGGPANRAGPPADPA